jgi:hypothetical protein
VKQNVALKGKEKLWKQMSRKCNAIVSADGNKEIGCPCGALK